MKKVTAVFLSLALAIPATGLLAQQSSGTAQKPVQVAQAEAGAAGAGGARVVPVRLAQVQALPVRLLQQQQRLAGLRLPQPLR